MRDPGRGDDARLLPRLYRPVEEPVDAAPRQNGGVADVVGGPRVHAEQGHPSLDAGEDGGGGAGAVGNLVVGVVGLEMGREKSMCWFVDKDSKRSCLKSELPIRADLNLMLPPLFIISCD